MLAKMDDIFAKSQIRPEIETGRNFPNYEENFGNKAEKLFVVDVLKNNKSARLVVENVELGTKSEDKSWKTDLWIKFRDIEVPLGIQYTFSTNEDEIRRHEEMLRERHYITKKESRDDANIRYSGNANVVLVIGDKMKIAHYWKESQKKEVDPAEVVGNEFVREIFKQIIDRLEEANLYGLRNTITKNFAAAFEDIKRYSKKKKRTGKTSSPVLR